MEEIQKQRDSQIDWRPIETAPKDGTSFIGRVVRTNYRGQTRPYHFLTKWGKDERTNAIGWVQAWRNAVWVQWEPTQWTPRKRPVKWEHHDESHTTPQQAIPHEVPGADAPAELQGSDLPIRPPAGPEMV